MGIHYTAVFKSPRCNPAAGEWTEQETAQLPSTVGRISCVHAELVVNSVGEQNPAIRDSEPNVATPLRDTLFSERLFSERQHQAENVVRETQ